MQTHELKARTNSKGDLQEELFKSKIKSSTSVDIRL